MLTKLSPVAYDVEAQPVRWLAFLDRVFAGDQQLIKFIQKAVGYSLAGDTSEQCLFINYGTGANGKSVFLKTIAALVGDYGQQVQTSTLMIKQHQGVNNDVATLRGARFLAATETDDGQKLAESTVKQLTGGDKVRARFLFQESFEFTPQFKIWLAANHKPEIRGNDHAIWRRIRLVPFNVTIPKAEQNPHLDAELKEELPGVLAWAVEGCLRWQREGLGEPEAVTKATADYREEQDAIAGFLSEKCVVGEHYQVTAKEIYYAYKTWCISNGEEALSAKWLGLQLRARGFLPDQDRKNRFYRGIGLIRDSNNDEVEF
jgi:putative DNA primase/helicase